MAKVTLIDEFDWMAVRATFADGTKANVTFSRGGQRVTLDPENPDRAERLSLIVMGALARMKVKDPAYPHLNQGELVKEMVKVGKASATFDAYLDGLKKGLMVSGERPKASAAGPEKTTATLVSKRGWQLDIAFPDGDRVSLKINKSSVGLTLVPQIPSKFDEVTKLVFAVKQAGIMDDETLAKTARECALASDGLNAWIEDLRAEVFPQAAPRR